MDENSIKSQLNNFTNEIGFNFNNDWFNVIWINKEEEILNQFLSECQDPIYEKYGLTIKDRINNLDSFVNSQDYKECIKRYGGSVSTKEEIMEFKVLVQTLNESQIKKKLLDYCVRVLNELGGNNFVAFLTNTDIKSEYDDLIKSILRHEWIHQLLFQNKIKFKSIKEDYWIYDEGLCTYFEYFLDNKLDILEQKRDEENYPYEKQYYINAIKFREMLKNIDISKHKEVIKSFYKSLI